MNKDIRKYIANCTLCRREKAKVQQYPLQMTDIPDRPFDKIAIDLVTECETSTSGNKHILTIINHLTGWPETFPIPDKSADTIVTTLINEYLPVHMCPRYILSDNSMEFKNNLMDQVLQQLGVDRIFSAPYHPQSNGKLEVFHKYLKPTLKKLCEKDPTNWDKYLNQVLASYHITPNLATTESPFCSSIWQRPQPSIAPTPRTHATLLRRPRFWITQPRNPQISPHYCQEGIGWEQICNCPENYDQRQALISSRRQSVLQKQTTRKMGPQVETWIPNCPYWAWWTFHLHREPSHWKSLILQCQGHHSWTTCWILECQHTIWKSQPIHQPSSKFTYNKTSVNFLTTIFIITTSCLFQHDHFTLSIHEFITHRTRRVHHIPTRPTSIPHMTFMDHYSPHLTWKFGTQLENLQLPIPQNSTTTSVLQTTPISTHWTNDSTTVGTL